MADLALKPAIARAPIGITPSEVGINVGASRLGLAECREKR